MSGKPQPGSESELSFLWKESRDNLLKLLERGRKIGWHRVGQPFPHTLEGRTGWAVWVEIPLEG